MKNPRIYLHLRCVLLMFLLAIGNAQAGPFSRARTEGQRLDDAQPVMVSGIYVYSFLQEGAGVDRRLSKDLEKYRQVMVQALESKGVRVGAMAMPRGSLTLDTTPLGVRGVEGFQRTLEEPSKAEASEIARAYREEERTLPAGFRLLLLPEEVVRSTGVQSGSRVIKTGSGTWFSRGAQASGVPHYSFRVYWLLEDVAGQPVAAGTTSGILDIRGFPAKPMTEQMIAELEQLGIQWTGAAALDGVN